MEIAFNKFYKFPEKEKFSKPIAHIYFSSATGSETLQTISWHQSRLISKELTFILHHYNEDKINTRIIAIDSHESLYSSTCISAVFSSGSAYYPLDFHNSLCLSTISSKALFANDTESTFKLLSIELFLSPSLFCDSVVNIWNPFLLNQLNYLLLSSN